MRIPTVGLALGAGAFRGFAHIGVLEIFEREGFERSSVPEPLPLKHLHEQLSLFSPEADAAVEELTELDVDNLTPMRAMEVLYKLKEKSRKASGHGR